MGMREKIARAIEAKLLACNAMSRSVASDWTYGPCLLAADAVLDAMMEPSEGMIEAGGRTVENQDMAADRPLPTLSNAYRAMILAAKQGA